MHLSIGTFTDVGLQPLVFRGWRGLQGSDSPTDITLELGRQAFRDSAGEVAAGSDGEAAWNPSLIENGNLEGQSKQTYPRLTPARKSW